MFGVKIRTNVLHTKGVNLMTNNERELINIIRESKNPEQALLTAVLIIGSALEQSLSYQEPSVDFPQAHV